jgi:hypothetical protein
MITERAMLAAVHISIWTAVKHDRKFSRDVAHQHGAHEGAGRYNSQSRLARLAEEERTSSLASTGWTIAELCHRPWFSSQTYAAHSREKLLPTQCCGPPRSRAERLSGK